MAGTATPSETVLQLLEAGVVANTLLCREHYRLTLHAPTFGPCAAGMFVQLSPVVDERGPALGAPLLPRAFSIGGMRRRSDGVEVDVVYRVVGVGTRWMAALAAGDRVNLLGPLGHPFPVYGSKKKALVVIGGVGLPPLLWLAEGLRAAGKDVLGFIGAQTADLLPLDMAGRAVADESASEARLCAAEFAAVETPLVVSTDDGTCGFRGNVVEALNAYAGGNELSSDDWVVYTCGPERMMAGVADFCRTRGIACQVCMERPMACGVGTCQSCVVTVKDDRHADGWRYALCCDEGPVFDALSVKWQA